MTLNMLIQTQNEPVAALISPPAASTEPEFSPLPDKNNQTAASSQYSSPAHLADEPLESFLSYLDDSVDEVTADVDKPDQVLFEEVNSVIEEAETTVRRRNESQVSTDSAEALSQFDKGKWVE